MIVEQHVDEDDPLSATDSAQDSPTSNEPNLESDEELQKRVEALLARAEGGSTEKVAVTDLLSFFGHKKLGRRIKVRVDDQVQLFPNTGDCPQQEGAARQHHVAVDRQPYGSHKVDRSQEMDDTGRLYCTVF